MRLQNSQCQCTREEFFKMDRIRFQIVWILFIILNTSNAFITNSKLFHDFSEMTTPKAPPQETTSLSELIQIQTDTIKQILSTTAAQDLNINKPISSKCEDIESDLKKSLINKEENVANDLKIRGDIVALTSLTTPEQTTTSSSQTTFSLLQPTVTQEYKYTEGGQNIILIPCLKRIIQNITTRRQNSEDTGEIFENIPNKYQEKPYLSLEKIYSPSGQFMYYMYRWNIDGKSSNSISSTSTTSTTEKTPELSERLRFVVKMPYSQPEAPSTYPWQFDPYAYYPKDMQPQYVNTPVKYKPIFNIIRTLAVPEEYHTSYMLNDPENMNNNKGNKN